MRPPTSRSNLLPRAILHALALGLSGAVATAQDLVPGAYTPVPVGVNIVNVATVFNGGAISFDPSLPVEDANANIGWTSFGLARTLNLAGRYANVGLGVPFLIGDFEGQVLGQFQKASRRGFGDMGGRIAINLYGAPAMTRQQFATYRQAMIVGLSFGVTAPVGQYNPDRYVNLGTNRWSFRPEIGISTTQGKWTFEGDFGAVLFTDNPNFVNQTTRAQSAIVAFQGHLIRTIRPGFWVAADANYWKGGRLTTDGVEASFEQENSRLGLTLAVPIGRHQMRISYSFGAYTTIGGDFHSVGASYSYAWAKRPAVQP